MDDIRAFMAGRQAPFRHNGLRAMFIAKEDESDEEKQVCPRPKLNDTDTDSDTDDTYETWRVLVSACVRLQKV